MENKNIITITDEEYQELLNNNIFVDNGYKVYPIFEDGKTMPFVAIFKHKEHADMFGKAVYKHSFIIKPNTMTVKEAKKILQKHKEYLLDERQYDIKLESLKIAIDIILNNIKNEY